MCGQRTLFDCTRHCHGCSSAVVRDGGDHCLHCGRRISYRMGFMNCGVPEATWWDALVRQVEPCGTGEYDVPTVGVVIR